jgi:hypothetical protein
MTGSQLALASRTGCKWANHAHLRCKLLQGSDSIFGRRMSREQIVHSLPRAGIDNEQMRSCGVLFGCDILDLMYSHADLRQRRYPVTGSLDPKILRRRFSAVAYDLELDLLAFIERGQTRPLHSRNVHKHILPAALRLDESIAFGRIKPLHSPGRHQSSPRGKRRRPPNLHIPVTAAIKIRHITNGLVMLIPANLRNQLSRSQACRVVRLTVPSSAM